MYRLGRHVSIALHNWLGRLTVCCNSLATCFGFDSSFSSWSFYVPLFGTLVNLGFLYWKRHDHPLNLLLLSTFTVLEAFTLGVVVAFYRTDIVIQALSVLCRSIERIGSLIF